MNPLTPQPIHTDYANHALAEQAVPGHGIPSQDTDSAAQVILEPQEAEREANSVLMGGAMMAGAATGGHRFRGGWSGGDCGWRHARCRGWRSGWGCCRHLCELGGFKQ